MPLESAGTLNFPSRQKNGVLKFEILNFRQNGSDFSTVISTHFESLQHGSFSFVLLSQLPDEGADSATKMQFEEQPISLSSQQDQVMSTVGVDCSL